jgi:hypothetical protein
VHDEGAYRASGVESGAPAGLPAGLVVAISSTDAKSLQSFLDRRGLEIGFVVDSQTGMSKMVVVDMISGRTVLEIPAGSPLESAAWRVATTL